MLNYKGYTGHIEFDDEAELFHGEVVDTKDVVTFQGRSVDEIVQAFRDSVDDYLDFCEQPEKVSIF
jgi:predicted HicB family RNase H-like nuclease